MTPLLHLRFKPQIQLQETPQGSLVLQDPPRSLPLDALSDPLIAALQLLTQEQGISESALTAQILQRGSWQALPQLHYLLQSFQEMGLICHTLWVDDRPWATWIPLTAAARFPASLASPDPNATYQLSRFTYSRWEQGQMLLETPLYPVQIRIEHWQPGAILSLLSTPQSRIEITNQIPNLTEPLIDTWLSWLQQGQMLDLDPTSSGLQYWEFHDLLFHSRSRLGRHSLITGKAYPFLEQIPPPPPLKSYSGPPIPLQRPDLETRKQTDRSFTQVLESRRSLRGQGSDPITLEQLGEFLFRSAHIQGFVWRDHLDCTLRPSPSGGACFPLEIYPVVHSCAGLDPGLYHYNPHHHHLDPVAPLTPAVTDLLTGARQATKGHQPTQILLVLAARFPRTMWVYRAISYALILKDVGALLQTFALVAAAMDLAGCSLGVGDGDRFAAAATTDYYLETSVGEFILGSAPAAED